MKQLTILLFASSFALISTGCTTALTAGVKKGDERNFARSLNDVSAGRAIKARMSRVEGFKLAGVDVEVAEGIVVLSGNVPRNEDRIEAERIAWSGPQVVQVGNEILIKGRQGMVRNTKDGVLNSSVRARLIAAKSVKARNISIEVNDGVVYLLGVARTPEELALTTHIASTTRGTSEVISYIKLADDRSRNIATGPGFNGQPSAQPYPDPYPDPYAQAGRVAGSQTYTGPPRSGVSEVFPLDVDLPPIGEAQTPNTSAPSTGLDNDAIESGEPYYRDPVTGERVIIPEGVTPIPYVPDGGPGSLGAGGAPLPPGASGSYIIDPKTGYMVPVFYPGK